jgi:4-amino-4-deoxy-L-arabinose transferase-like glycosyltransferase
LTPHESHDTEARHAIDADDRSRWTLRAILLAALVVRLWQIDWGLPNLYEEATPFTIAWRFWNWGGPGLSFDPKFFNYPALTYYVQFIVQTFHFASRYSDLEAFRSAYELDPTAFIVLARLVTVCFDVGSIWMIFLLGRKIGGVGAGLAAALFLSISPLHVQHAQMVNVDIPLTFFTLCSLYAITLIVESPTRRRYLVSGACIGLAASTKYTGAFLIPVLLVGHFMSVRSWAEFKTALGSRSLLWSLAIIPAIFLLLNPYIVLDFGSFQKGFAFEQAHMSAGHLGVDPSEGSSAFYLLDVIPRIVGWPLLLFGLFACVEIFRKRRRAFYPLVAFLLLYFAVISLWVMRADRYLLPAEPLLLLLAASGVFFALELVFRAPSHAVVRGVVLGMLLLAAAFVPVEATYAYHRSHLEPDTRTLAAQWIGDHRASVGSVAMTTVGIRLDTRSIYQIDIPFHPIYPELTIPFYRPELYTDVDLIVVSGFDYGRFKSDPVRYRPFLEFYGHIERSWSVEYFVHPSPEQGGPDIWLIRPRETGPDSVSSAALEQIVRVGNEDWVFDYLLRLGVQSFTKERFGRSADFLGAANRLRPDDLRPLAYGSKSLLRLNRFFEAQGMIDAYLKHSPDNLEMRGLRASSLLGQDRLAEAEKEFLRMLTMDPNNGPAYQGLFSVYERTGSKSDLVATLLRYQKTLTAGSEAARAVASRIERLNAR